MAKKKHNDLFFGIKCNEDQEKLRDAILGDEYNVILCDATAGSGKTLITVACARLLCSDYGYDSAVYIFPIIKRIISRCHDDCKVIRLGCQAQTDIPVSQSGFKELLDRMESFETAIRCELPISYRGKLAMHIDRL